LALNAAFVDQNPGIGRESSEGHQYMVVENTDLLHRALFLQLGDSLLLDPEHDCLVSTYADGRGALLHGFLSVLDLLIAMNIKCRVYEQKSFSASLTWNKCPSGEKTVIALS
jgi:hypothetical protein